MAKVELLPATTPLFNGLDYIPSTRLPPCTSRALFFLGTLSSWTRFPSLLLTHLWLPPPPFIFPLLRAHPEIRLHQMGDLWIVPLSF